MQEVIQTHQHRAIKTSVLPPLRGANSLSVSSIVEAPFQRSSPSENPSPTAGVDGAEESLTPKQIAELYGFERHHQIRACSFDFPCKDRSPRHPPGYV